MLIAIRNINGAEVVLNTDHIVLIQSRSVGFCPTECDKPHTEIHLLDQNTVYVHMTVREVLETVQP